MSVSAVQHWQVVVTVLFVLTEFGVITSGKVLLTSNLEEDGQTAACPDNEVVFICEAYNTGTLAWLVSNSNQDLEIVLLDGDEVGTARASGEFQGILTGNSSTCNAGNMNSTLTVVAKAKHNGTTVKCSTTSQSGTAAEMMLLVASTPPSPPQHFRYSTEPNTCKISTVLLKWEPPLSLGGASYIDRYTVNLTNTSDDRAVYNFNADTVEEEQALAISDAFNYTAYVTAWNCIGESTAAMQTIQTGCEQPSRPPRGYLVRQDEACTAEGSRISFGCSLNLILEGVSESVCRGGEWQPNPRDVVCLSDCGHPATHKYVTVYYGSTSYNLTREGSEIDYKCSTGYVPQDEWHSVCTVNGTWSPNPSHLECKAQCDKPKPPVNGSLLSVNESTLEGAEIVYRCDMGLVPSGNMTAVCSDDRKWHPDPAQEQCQEQGSGWNTKTVIVVCATLPTATIFVTASLVLIIIFIIKRRSSWQSACGRQHVQRTSLCIPSALSIPTPPAAKEEPVYDEIVSHGSSYPLNVKQNTAYGEGMLRMTSDEGGVQLHTV